MLVIDDFRLGTLNKRDCIRKLAFSIPRNSDDDETFVTAFDFYCDMLDSSQRMRGTSETLRSQQGQGDSHQPQGDDPNVARGDDINQTEIVCSTRVGASA
jgi:hypothetical protein